MTDSALLMIGLLVCAAVAIAGLFRPFLGMLVFIVIHFCQPGELIPALAPFRIEFVYGSLLIGVLLLQRLSSSHESSPLFSDRILLSLFLLIGAGLLSIPFSVWLSGAAASVLEMIKLVTIVFLLKLLIDSEARLRAMLWCMVAVAAWFAASSLSSFLHGEFYALKYDWGTLDRAQGINSVVGGPNELAGVLLALLPLLIVLLRSTSNIFTRILLTAFFGLSLAAISLTGSRIAMIGLLVTSLYYIFQSKHKLLVCAGCLLIGSLIWSSLPPEYQQRYLTVESYAAGGQLDASNEVRLEVWRAGWQIFSKYPVLGVGAGQFSTAYGLIYLNGKSGGWFNPHNLLIQVACEIGLVGLAAFVYFLWQLFKGVAFALQESRENKLNLSYQVAVACGMMYLGVFVLSLVSHTLYRPHWYLLAGLVAANRSIAASGIKERNKRKPSPSSVSWDAVEHPLAARPAVFGMHRGARAAQKEGAYRAGYQHS